MFTECPYCGFLVALDAQGQPLPRCPNCAQRLRDARAEDSEREAAAQDAGAPLPPHEPDHALENRYALPASPPVASAATTPVGSVPSQVPLAGGVAATAATPGAPNALPTSPADVQAESVVPPAPGSQTAPLATPGTAIPAADVGEAGTQPVRTDIPAASLPATDGVPDSAAGAASDTPGTPTAGARESPRDEPAGIAAVAPDLRASTHAGSAASATVPDADTSDMAAQSGTPQDHKLPADIAADADTHTSQSREAVAAAAPAAPARAARAAPSFARAARLAPAVSRKRRVLETAALGGLLLLLGVQLLLADRARLSADARWRPLVATLCGALGCTLPAWREPSAFRVVERDVRAHGQGVLRVSARIRNDARWAQPWPALQLTLSDAHGRAMATRIFQPRDYLGGAPAQASLGSGQDVALSMEIVEPGPQAVAFTFDFR